MVEWLERHDCDRYGYGLKPTRVILLFPWETFYGTFSCLVVLASSSKSNSYIY